jgi:formylglycine-generating enzyme required for sulfatase activity
VERAEDIWVEPETGMKFVWIPPGEFMMGSDSKDAEYEEKPIHKVILDGFWMGKYPVTVDEFSKFVKEENYRTEAERGDGSWVYDGNEWEKKKDANWKNPYFKQKGSHPVVLLSWNDCLAFIDWMNTKGAKEFRLPTEAEWEYACRAGTRGNRYGNLDNIAWYDENSGSSTHPVGRKSPNAWGLYDMLGNANEWCQDWYDANYYMQSPERNPRGPSSGSYRVIRGGSWSGRPFFARASNRCGSIPDGRYYCICFRLSRTA